MCSSQLNSSVDEVIGVHAPASLPLLRGSRLTPLSFVRTLLGSRGGSLEGPAASLVVKNQISTSREFFVQLLVHPLRLFHRLSL